MQSQTSDNSGFNKLKKILFLGLSCNRTTIIGCLLVWMYVTMQNELSSGWSNFLIVVCLAPFFMGDAVNRYVLGRIKLEHENGWNDIRMTSEYKEHISFFYYVYRTISICSSYGFAVIMLYILMLEKLNILEEVPGWLVFFAPFAATILFTSSLRAIIKGIAPLAPQYLTKGLVFRFGFILLSMYIWYQLLKYFLDNLNISWFVFTTGVLYFLICGIMHPLPKNGTLFESISRDFILSQAQAMARARNAENVNPLDFNIKPQDIEDASIVSSDKEKSIDSSELKPSVSLPSISDAIITESLSEPQKKEDEPNDSEGGN